MRRVGVEGLLNVATSAVMVTVVMLLASVSGLPLVSRGSWSEQAANGCTTGPLEELSDSGVQGIGRFCVEARNARSSLQVRGLRQGEVYSAWVAYFDRPSACFHTPCGFHDLLGDDPPGVLGRIDSAVASTLQDVEFRAEFRDLHPSPGAHVMLVVLNHGAWDEQSGHARARQLLAPQMFELGAPMAGAHRERTRGWLHARVGFTLE